MRQRLVATLSSLLLALGVLAVLQVASAPAASAATQVFPIPTSASGAQSIVAAPDGNLWFVEKEANKLARVSPAGQITEFSLFAEFDSTIAKDVDVAPDGTVWVLYNSGTYVAGVNNAGQAVRGPYNIDVFGEEIRVATDGTPWITASDAGDDFVVRIVGDSFASSANSPECGDAINRAADGGFWCRTDSGLTKLNGDASGGTTYPANNFAAYPYAIAPGPVGSIWFGRYFGGTIFTSPDDGEVGFLDAGSGAVTAYDTGSRTAPNSLIQGPDGNMWFTSIGAAKGIGHIAPNGTGGRLTAIGNYAPNSIAFGTDGAVYATDATNNVIIKTSTADLQVTNVDPGEGSVLGNGGGGAAAGATFKVGKKPLTVKNNRVGLKLACPKTSPGCTGTARLLTNAKKKPQAVSNAAKFRLKPGKKKTLRFTLSKKGLKAVKKGKVTKLKVAVYAKGSKTPVAVQVIKVRR